MGYGPIGQTVTRLLRENDIEPTVIELNLDTVRRLRAEYGAALEALVDALHQRERGQLTEQQMAATTDRLGQRFELTEGQTAVLGRAAGALAAERDQIRKLGALVAVGHDARVMLTDGELLRGVRFFGGGARTHSLLMSYRRGVIRFLDTVHTFDRQFPPRVRL